MSNFPILETDRLILDRLKESDAPLIAKYANNKKISIFTRTLPFPYYEKDALTWIAIADKGFEDKDQFVFAMRDKNTQEFIGGIGLTVTIEHNRAELGYWLAEPFWNKGYSTEAVKELLKFGFEVLNLNKIIAVFIDLNAASGKVLEKSKMIKEAELKEHDMKDGEYKTLIQYRLTQKEYQDLLS